MNRDHRHGSVRVWPVLFALFSVACSSPGGLRDEKPTQADHPAPFQETETGGDPRAPGGSAERNDSSNAESSPPFRDAQALPAGTLLTVRLRKPVLGDSNPSTETFDAVVDEPVLIEGSTMLPRGARVAGRVESAQASQVNRDRGFVRLTLSSVAIAGRDWPIQTSSLFVRAGAGNDLSNPGESSPHLVRLEGGRRLTFRLTESAAIGGSTPNLVR